MKIKKIDINEIRGFHLGNAQDAEAGTGVTVIIADGSATAGVDVRGGGPATRETDLLRSENTVDKINAVVLSGGSAFGLEAGSGVMRALASRGSGFKVGDITVPIVSGASLFDLAVGRSDVFPDVNMGIEAVDNAYSGEPFEGGNHGAGTGATVGKMLGMDRAMKTGLGTFACSDDIIQVGAIAAVNACADIYNGAGNIIAGLRTKDGQAIHGTIKALKSMVHESSDPDLKLEDIRAMAAEESSRIRSESEDINAIAKAMSAAYEQEQSVAAEPVQEEIPAEEPAAAEPVEVSEIPAEEPVYEPVHEEDSPETFEEPEAEPEDEPDGEDLYDEPQEFREEPETYDEIEEYPAEDEPEDEPEQPAEVHEPAAEPEAVAEPEPVPEPAAEEEPEAVVEPEPDPFELSEEEKADMGYDIPFNTTIACLITNADLTKSQANKLASILHDAYARAIKPVHSTLDGDTIFVMATGECKVNFDAFAALATDVMQYAIIDGAMSAQGAYGLPAARDMIIK